MTAAKEIPPCPRCHTPQHVLEESWEHAGKEFHCTMDGTYFWIAPVPVKWVDPEGESDHRRIGRPPKQESRKWRITHCPRNHPYSEDNTSVSGGSRPCKTCRRETAASRRKETAA